MLQCWPFERAIPFYHRFTDPSHGTGQSLKVKCSFQLHLCLYHTFITSILDGFFIPSPVNLQLEKKIYVFQHIVLLLLFLQTHALKQNQFNFYPVQEMLCIQQADIFTYHENIFADIVHVAVSMKSPPIAGNSSKKKSQQFSGPGHVTDKFH